MVLPQFSATLVYFAIKLTQGVRHMISFKGGRFMKEIILMMVRWYLAYVLSSCDPEDWIERIP